MGDLARLVRPLMVTCIGCFAWEMWSNDLARLATLAKLVVMDGCLDAKRSCSRVGPLGR